MADMEMNKLNAEDLEAVSGGASIDTIDMDYCSRMATNYAKRSGDFRGEMDKYCAMENQYLSYASSLGEGVAPKFSDYLKSHGYGYWFA